MFRDYNDLSARIDDPDLPVTADSVLVLQHAGPLGGPGMPEWGMLPIPKKLLQAGVRDMVRISDARMSGTSYGTCVLHVAPESFVGGPLAFVRDGDLIELNVPERRLTLQVSEAELATRRAGWTAPAVQYPAGTASSTRSTCCRRIRGATSIFCRREQRSRSLRSTRSQSRRSRRPELQFGHCDRHSAGTEVPADVPRPSWTFRSIVSSKA